MKKKLILLVEDDELDVISVQRSLKKLNDEYELHSAFNGIEAMSMLQKDKHDNNQLPDVILLDLNMPKMNGIEFLKALRANPDFSHIKVFIMTTSSEQSDRIQTQELGISGYIIKPLNFTDNNKRVDSMDAFVQFHIRKIFTAHSDN